VAARPLLLVLCAALGLPAVARAQDPPPSLPGPCEDVRAILLLCPDLRMAAPYDLEIDRRTRPGRVLLRAANSIDSIGLGPVELVGRRDSRVGMRVVQRIHRSGGGSLAVPSTGRLIFKRIPRQGPYWKYQHAARFELWRLDRAGERTRLVRTGPKVAYCLRDLRRRVGGRASPRREVYPACSQSRRARWVRLGTSVGWSDVYPSSYHEQWVDVTGLRGLFELVHIADPRDGLEERDETNNAASTRLRLPPRRRGGREEEGGEYRDT
jgi:hypothetical protein